jgi:hypothetical protein
MSSWNKALYDTCSLVILGKILLNRADVRARFCSVHAVEASLCPARMLPRTAAILRATIRPCSLPPLGELRRILLGASFPLAVAEVDQLTYAAALHHRLNVVTADRNLAGALARKRIKVTSPELVLKDLIQAGALSDGEAALIRA